MRKQLFELAGAALISLLLMAAIVLMPRDAFAATYFVRTDGGTPAQCTGLVDAPLDISRACAWSHPFAALPTSETGPLKSGDTLRIGAGTYRMGLGAPSATGCSSSYPWDCYMRPVPAGVTISGAGARLVGVERALRVLNLEGSQNVTVTGLEITDGLACAEFLPPAKCQRDVYPYGDWAAVGIAGKGAKNITLTDINVHGMANRGITAGGIAAWTLTRVKINGNAWAGWDGDVGAGSGNTGPVTFVDSEIAWNGCIGGTTPIACVGQNGGGYGDGLAAGPADAGTWTLSNVRVHHNSSDGVDLLYATGAGKITVAGGTFEANAGNQLKTKGPASISGATIKGNCYALKAQPGFLPDDNCRALGNALSVALTDNATVMVDQLAAGEAQGDCMILVEGGNAAARFSLTRSTITGGTDVRGNEPTCGVYKQGSAQAAYAGNTWSNVKAGSAPPNAGGVDPPVDPIPPTCPVMPPVVCPPVPDNSAAKASIRAQAQALRQQADALDAAAMSIKP